MNRALATLDEDVAERIRKVVGPRRMSGFLGTAARERQARLELLGLLDELDAPHGPPAKAVVAHVARDARKIFGRR